MKYIKLFKESKDQEPSIYELFKIIISYECSINFSYNHVYK